MGSQITSDTSVKGNIKTYSQQSIIIQLTFNIKTHRTILSPYSTGNWVRLGHPMQMKLANANPNARRPNTNYIPLARVGPVWHGVGSEWLGVGSPKLGAGILDTNMLVSSMQKGCVEGLNQCDNPMRMVSHCSGI